LAELDAYTFSASPGDMVIARMGLTAASPQFSSKLRIFGPDGGQICLAQSNGYVNFMELVCSLNASGIYTLIAGDHFGSGQGAYAIHLQRTTSPANATPINLGDSLTGVIANIPELDAYTFSGIAGNQAKVTMTRTSGGVGPKFRVFRPNGTELCKAEAIGSPAQTVCILDATGTYVILAGDLGGTATGHYTLTLQAF
jgi:hypothetical protein